MSNTLAIFKKELRSYFSSPIAYCIIIAFLLVSTGLFFWDKLGRFFLYNQADMRAFFGLMPWMFLFIVPAMTMRLWAEEKKMGTVEILMTLPVRSHEVILGKYLASFVLLAVMVALTVPVPTLVLYLGDPDGGQIFASYIGVFLMGSAYIAIGLCASTLTENQIIAFILGIVVSLVFFLVGFADVQLLSYFGLATHFMSIARGVIDSRDLIYYLSMTGFFLYLSVLFVEVRSWR
jgi:ABC-2 type transport system permease protein